jgi:hypothetical protein
MATSTVVAQIHDLRICDGVQQSTHCHHSQSARERQVEQDAGSASDARCVPTDPCVSLPPPRPLLQLFTLCEVSDWLAIGWLYLAPGPL